MVIKWSVLSATKDWKPLLRGSSNPSFNISLSLSILCSKLNYWKSNQIMMSPGMITLQKTDQIKHVGYDHWDKGHDNCDLVLTIPANQMNPFQTGFMTLDLIWKKLKEMKGSVQSMIKPLKERSNTPESRENYLV